MLIVDVYSNKFLLDLDNNGVIDKSQVEGGEVQNQDEILGKYFCLIGMVFFG